ncbi:MAG: sigma-70 factor domain-containing protein, partial [Desulfofustis sp.]|nr:sigma-70 factor domain-containing protein [Desulfofustis sp.]
MAADDYSDLGMDEYEATEDGEQFVNDDEDSSIWDLTGIFHPEEKAVPVVLPEDVPEDRRKNVRDRRKSPFGDRRQGDRRRLSRSPLQNGTHSIDPMNIYLREMGSLTLLSHEEELKLARMMEEGKFRIQTAALSTQLAFPVLQQLAADLSSGRSKIFQIVHGVPDNEPELVKRETEVFLDRCRQAAELDGKRAELLAQVRAGKVGEQQYRGVRRRIVAIGEQCAELFNERLI